MAKRKSKEPNYCIAMLDGGPRNGEQMRVVVPPPPYIRLAFPEWCAYVLKEKRKEAARGQPSEYRFEYAGGDVSDELKASMRHF